MTRTSAMALVALAAVGVGCGTDPVQATWTYSLPIGGGTTISGDVTFQASGDLSATTTTTGCTGTESILGLAWSDTPTVLTVTGSEACTGSVTCPATEPAMTAAYVTLVLPGWMQVCQTGAIGATNAIASECNYSLSDDNDSLLVTDCSSSTTDPMVGQIVLTRKP
jgi:hypothetical protein